MNLEAIEQRCLAYLAQVTRPLAPVGQLLRHLHDDPETAGVSEDELLQFLRHHEDIAVIEATGLPSEPGMAEAFAAADIPAGPYVILKSRMPTAHEWSEQFRAQMESMVEALESAHTEAMANGNQEAVREITALLDRARRLQKRLGELR